MSENPRGRPTSYSDEIAKRICQGLAEGLTLRQICKADDMPAESTVRNWALTDYNGFFAHYSHAREIGYHSMADELVEIVDDAANDWMSRENRNLPEDDPKRVAWQINGEHVTRSRLRADTRKWLLSKALPKIYGDKIALTDGEGAPLYPERIEVEIVRPGSKNSGS